MNIYLKPVNVEEATSSIKDIKVSIKSSVIIGRGSLLKCADKKISRHLGILFLEDQNLYIKSTNSNPLHITNSHGVLSLLDGESLKLNEGDQFSLLKDKFCYQICIPYNETEKEDIAIPAINIPSNEDQKESRYTSVTSKPINLKEDNDEKENTLKIMKRSLPAWMESSSITDNPAKNLEKEPSTKKLKASLTDSKMQVSPLTEENLFTTTDLASSESKPTNPGNAQTYVTTTTQEIVEDTQQSKTDKSDKKSPAKRESCPYGAKCYRKNPLHWQQLAHPNDSDFESETEKDDEDKPECEFGTKCYRKNTQHTRDFKHTRKRQPKRKAQRNVKETGETSSEDEYDLDDKFIDDSSDDYCPTGSDTESEGTL